MHEAGIIHGDAHVRHCLVHGKGGFRLIDFEGAIERQGYESEEEFRRVAQDERSCYERDCFWPGRKTLQSYELPAIFV